MGGTVSGASDTEGSSARHSGVKIKRKIGRVLAFQGVTHWGSAALFPVHSCVFPRAGLSCQPRASLPGPQPTSASDPVPTRVGESSVGGVAPGGGPAWGWGALTHGRGPGAGKRPRVSGTLRPPFLSSPVHSPPRGAS